MSQKVAQVVKQIQRAFQIFLLVLDRAVVRIWGPLDKPDQWGLLLPPTPLVRFNVIFFPSLFRQYIRNQHDSVINRNNQHIITITETTFSEIEKEKTIVRKCQMDKRSNKINMITMKVEQYHSKKPQRMRIFGILTGV